MSPSSWPTAAPVRIEEGFLYRCDGSPVGCVVGRDGRLGLVVGSEGFVVGSEGFVVGRFG